MGLINKLKGELVDIIEWVDDSRSTLAWRFPRYNNEIKNGAQLIVREGQRAVFVYRGQLADSFEPGHYELTTENLPILSTLQGWKHGFNSPFRSEVYFINTRPVTDLRWGTPQPVTVRDPDFGMVQVRANGLCVVKIADADVFLREVIGTDSAVEAEEITELLRRVITLAFSDMVLATGLGAIDLQGRQVELSAKLRDFVAERVDDEFGLAITDVTMNISLPEEITQAMTAGVARGVEEKGYVGNVGDIGRYQQVRAADAMLAAAGNPGGSAMGDAMQAGMGVAMAGQMAGAAAGRDGARRGQAPPAGPPPLPGPGAVPRRRGGQPGGPVHACSRCRPASPAARSRRPRWCGRRAWPRGRRPARCRRCRRCSPRRRPCPRRRAAAGAAGREQRGRPRRAAAAASAERAQKQSHRADPHLPVPDCGGQLEFDIGDQKLKCPNCGNVQDIIEDAGRVTAEQDFRTAVARLHEPGRRRRPRSSGEKEVVCQNCGGHTTFTGTLTSTRCPYCATPIQRDDVHDAPARLPVDGVLPFQVDETGARSRSRSGSTAAGSRRASSRSTSRPARSPASTPPTSPTTPRPTPGTRAGGARSTPSPSARATTRAPRPGSTGTTCRARSTTPSTTSPCWPTTASTATRSPPSSRGRPRRPSRSRPSTSPATCAAPTTTTSRRASARPASGWTPRSRARSAATSAATARTSTARRRPSSR